MKLIKPFGIYSHGINLGNWFPCWNLSLNGRLLSPDFAALCDPGLAEAHKSVHDQSVDYLRSQGLPQGTMSPRAAWYVNAAALIRRGGHVEIGAENTKWLTRGEMDEILALSDIELELEEIRRKTSLEAASRLCSLWVAEDSDVGHAHIRSMLGPDTFIFQVSIVAAIRFSKLDTRWFDLYCSTRNEEYAVNYWKGVPSSNSQTWEFLVEGCIEACETRDLDHIRKHGAHLALRKECK